MDNQTSSDSDNEDFLIGVESDLFEAADEEVEKREEHRQRLERRRKCNSLVDEAKRKGLQDGYSQYELRNGSIITWLDEKGNQQGQAWECSLRLCRALETRSSLFQGKRVIELGCGLGIPGMVAGRLGAATVLLSDIPGALAPAQRVVDSNNLNSIVFVHPLLWGAVESTQNALNRLSTFESNRPTTTSSQNIDNNSHESSNEVSNSANSSNNSMLNVNKNTFDVILCSDLIYGDEEPARKLVETLIELSDHNTLIISLHERRMTGDKGTSFFSALEQSGIFSVETIPFNATTSSLIINTSNNHDASVESDAVENEFFCLTEIRRTY